MNRCIKVICLSILATASANAMNYENELGKQLIDTVLAGNHEKAKQLIHEGAPVDYENEHGYTPLFAATQSNNPECVRILLEARAQVDQTSNGATALHYAARNGKYETLKRLLAAKPSVNKPDQYGTTALVGAVLEGSLDCLKALIAAGAQVNYSYNGSYYINMRLSPLSWAVQRWHLDCAEELIEAMLCIPNQMQMKKIDLMRNNDNLKTTPAL